jgi:hypothetical protein
MGLAPSLSYGMAVPMARAPRSAAQSLLFFHFSGPLVTRHIGIL